MTTELPQATEPLALKSNEGLGPLPPCAQMFAPRWPSEEPGYTADQMLAFGAQERAAERERCAAAVRATPTHTWVDGSDQWGQPCPAKVVTTREQYANSCLRA